MVNQREPLDFRDARAWRQWLERNGAKSDGEWLFVYKKGAEQSGLQYPEALDEALCFGWIDGQIRAVDKNRFRQRWTPRRKGSNWSAVNKAKVKRLVADGRMGAAGLAAIREAKRTGKWQAAYSSRAAQPTVPTDLRAALAAAPPALANFSAWAPSSRVPFIH